MVALLSIDWHRFIYSRLTGRNLVRSFAQE